jgi:hypothetical protein
VTDFLNPVVREKKRFENLLDDSVAKGLNAGIEVLMNQVCIYGFWLGWLAQGCSRWITLLRLLLHRGHITRRKKLRSFLDLPRVARRQLNVSRNTYGFFKEMSTGRY